MIQRLPDWPARLVAYLEFQRGTRFAWGSADCVHFAAGAVEAITGRQVLPARWASAAEAARLLRAVGGLSGAVASVLPALPGPLSAMRGDVVLVQAPSVGGRARRQWLAVADGARWWMPGPTGLACGDMALAVRAWGVGHG